MTSERAYNRAFLGVSALLFLASTVVTMVWCASMSAMGGMQMPGGWTMSMAWMPMPGQSWLGAAAMFLGMWIVMMLALFQASTTTGNGHAVEALPIERTVEILMEHRVIR
jgi:hypothetical protein